MVLVLFVAVIIIVVDDVRQGYHLAFQLALRRLERVLPE